MKHVGLEPLVHVRPLRDTPHDFQALVGCLQRLVLLVLGQVDFDHPAPALDLARLVGPPGEAPDAVFGELHCLVRVFQLQCRSHDCAQSRRLPTLAVAELLEDFQPSLAHLQRLLRLALREQPLGETPELHALELFQPQLPPEGQRLLPAAHGVVQGIHVGVGGGHAVQSLGLAVLVLPSSSEKSLSLACQLDGSLQVRPGVVLGALRNQGVDLSEQGDALQLCILQLREDDSRLPGGLDGLIPLFAAEAVGRQLGDRQKNCGLATPLVGSSEGLELLRGQVQRFLQ
mmetsp:Transcript_88362/g.224952  ORF Transcript_88362/g.224952 Transcript_88362/m.224952 type:complete len:287 (-) Transcript_88362:360-1220(-)